MNITGNTIFIPGATSGIGLALALELQAKGNTVVVGGRRAELLEQIAGEHPGLDTVRIDTADATSIARRAGRSSRSTRTSTCWSRWPASCASRTGTPRGLPRTAEATVTTNVLGPIRLIGAFIEHLQRRPDATIVTVSSGLAFSPLRVTPSYNATKAAIHMLSESIRLQLAGTRVEVSSSCRRPCAPLCCQGSETAPPCRWTSSSRGRRAARLAAGREGDPGRAREVPALRRGPWRLRPGGRDAERHGLLGQLNRTGRTGKYVSTTHRSRRRHPPSPRPQATQIRFCRVWWPDHVVSQALPQASDTSSQHGRHYDST